jgi:hypothetical protein
MPRYWKEPHTAARYGDSPPDTLAAPARGLVIQELICVSVCSFTFKFYSGDEIQEYIAFFEKKTHPSSTLPIPAGSDSFFRWHSQRWYDPANTTALRFYKRQGADDLNEHWLVWNDIKVVLGQR